VKSPDLRPFFGVRRIKLDVTMRPLRRSAGWVEVVDE
jgi:hypothetical protein